MARIPTFEQLGNQTPNPSQGAASVPGSTAGIDAIGQLASIGAELATQVVKNDRALKVASNTTNASMELENYAFELKKNDRDYDTQFDRYQNFVKETDKKYQKLFDKDIAGYQTFKQNFGELAFKKGFDIRGNAITGQLDRQKGDVNLTLSTLSELAVQGDDAQRNEVGVKAQLLLNDAVQNGVLTSDESTKAFLGFRDQSVSALVRRDILSDPDQAAQKLLLGQYEGLSSEKQMMWLEKANAQAEARQRQSNVDEDRLYRDQERAEKRTQQEMSKAGDKLLSTGQLTPDWIERNRDNIGEGDYRYFYKQLREGETGTTNTNIYTNLMLRASNGEDVRDAARGELHSGNLQLKDFDKLVVRAEKNSPQADVPNWYKRGESYIKETLRVSDMNPDPSAPQRLANAMDEWNTWVDQNKDAKPEDAQKAYRRITDDYQLIKSTTTTLSAPTPTYMVGSRAAINIDETEAKTVEAFQSNKISEQEFKRQSLLIQQWRQAAEQSQKPAPPAGP